MRFAVAGDSPAVEGLLREIISRPEHDLALLIDAPELYARIASLAPAARLGRGALDLLSQGPLDAVIVAGQADEVLSLARQAALAGKMLLAGPLVGRSATFVYEMALLAAEQPVPLLPLFTLRGHPLASRLRNVLDAGALGAIRHVQLERRLDSEAPGGLSAEDVADAFLTDADLFRSVWGDYDQITATRLEDSAGAISLASVTLGGPHAPPAAWSAAAGTEPQWRMQVVGERGTATLTGDADAGDLTWELTLRLGAPQVSAAGFDSAGWIVDQIESLARPGSADAATRGGLVTAATWDDLTRGAEMLEAVERSIRRRRTIDLYFETHSERGQFKTQMTAAGCVLLVLTLAAVLVFATAELAFDVNPTLKLALFLLMFAPLGLFLGLQGLMWLARPASSKPAEPADGPAGPRGAP